MRRRKIDWVIYSFIVMFSLGCMLLIVKKLTLMGVNSVLLNLYLFGMVFLGFIGVNALSGKSFLVSPNILWWLLAAAVFSLIGNYAVVKGISLAPNPGYAMAIASGRILVVTIAAIFLFKSDMNPLKLAGVFTVMAGIVMLSV